MPQLDAPLVPPTRSLAMSAYLSLPSGAAPARLYAPEKLARPPLTHRFGATIERQPEPTVPVMPWLPPLTDGAAVSRSTLQPSASLSALDSARLSTILLMKGSGRTVLARTMRRDIVETCTCRDATNTERRRRRKMAEDGPDAAAETPTWVDVPGVRPGLRSSASVSGATLAELSEKRRDDDDGIAMELLWQQMHLSTLVQRLSPESRAMQREEAARRVQRRRESFLQQFHQRE